MLELRYFVSTYFTDFALVLAAHEQTSGLYNKDNPNKLHFILNKRTTGFNVWLEYNDEDGQEVLSRPSPSFLEPPHLRIRAM